MAAVAPFDVRGTFTPDVAMLELAVDALDLADIPGSDLLEYEGLRERYLPEIEFSGRVEHRNSQYAISATACLRGRLRPDLLNDAGWWNTRLWIYATYALTIYTRAAAERHDTTPQHIAELIAQRREHNQPPETSKITPELTALSYGSRGCPAILDGCLSCWITSRGRRSGCAGGGDLSCSTGVP